MTARLSEGERLGDFVIDRHLANGGNGDVYVAHRADDGSTVALKLLSTFSPAAAVRFEREGRILGRLDHPHIVRSITRGRSDGRAYLAMEFLRGETVEDRLKRAPLPPAEAIAIGVQVAEGLAYAHAAGVVHRDLKPTNVFLCAGSSIDAKILDFGIALAAGERKLTMTGEMIGTWVYMSPEQARGESDIDSRTDVWSFAVMLYEMLSGRVPFQSETAPGTLTEILFGDPPPLATLVSGLPPALTSIVMAALEKDRARRPARIEMLRDVLVESGRDASIASLAPITVTRDGVKVPVSSGTGERRLAVVVVLRGVRDPSVVAQFAEQLGGESIRLAGDSMLAIFGHTRWNGDEPDRALRFALLATPLVRALGIATGKVTRDGDTMSGTAIDGAAALVSARDGIWIDGRTLPLVRGRFEVEPAADGSVALLGLPASPVTPAREETPFTGRDIELALLERSVRDAVQGERITTTVVVGATGIGKTRLRVEALARVMRSITHATSLVAHGDPARRFTPLHALRDALEEWLGPEAAALFDPENLRERDAVARVDRAHAAFESALLGLATHGPAILVLEDAQWLDAATREAVRWFVENAPDAPVAIWVFTRPEARDVALSLLPGAQSVELGPLAPDEAAAMFRSIAPDADSSVAEPAAGHPLFLEELARAHLEARSGEGSAYEVPLSIEAALHAQIDQLELREREFVKRAAVFGRAFWTEAVVALGGDADAIPVLRRADLVLPRRKSRIEGAREYAFRSAFSQEVAYGLWLEDARSALHREVAAWLDVHPGAAPDEIARHFELGGEPERAAAALVVAADASARFADATTTRAHVERILGLTRDPALRFRALVAQDEALLHASDRAAQRAGLETLDAVARSLGERERAEAAWRRCLFHRSVGEIEQAREAGEHLARLAKGLADDRLACAAEIELAALHGGEAQWDRAQQHVDFAMQRAARLDDPWWRARVLGTSALVLSESGRTMEGLDAFEAAGREFARAGDPRREALVKMNAAAIMLDLGRIDEALVRLTESRERSQTVGNARTVAVADHNLGIASRLLGRFDEATQMQTRALVAARALRHERLACAVLGEQVHLALATHAARDELRVRATEAASHAQSLRAPAVTAPVLAVALRATHAAGDDIGPLDRACREALVHVASMLVEAEVRLALGSARDDSSETARAMVLLESWLTRCSPEDRSAARAAMLRRWSVSSLEGPGATRVASTPR